MKKIEFSIGFKYKAMLNGQERTFEVLEFDGTMYGIRWDDGDEEWAYPKDLDDMVKEAIEIREAKEINGQKANKYQS